MTQETPTFGPADVAGSKFNAPSDAVQAHEGLIEEAIRRKQWSRGFAAFALGILSIAATGCLVFSMWVGCHFLGVLDGNKDREDLAAAIQMVSSAPAKNEAQTRHASKLATQKTKESKPPETPKEDFYFKLLAPLIPATFSSAIAIILFITIARLVTNFEKMGKEESEKEQTEDYGAIAILVQEIWKVIKSIKGKD